jgi:hypothetical protein
MTEERGASQVAPWWFRLIPLFIGSLGVLLQIVDRTVSGQPGDQTLTYGSIVLVGLGLGLSLDWLRKRNE